MDELLKALREGDVEEIDNLAVKLFSTSAGGCNKAQINEFEYYAPCEVFVLESDQRSTFMGGIKYNDKTYMFG